MKKWVIMVLAVVGLILAACSSQASSPPAPASNSSASAAPAASAAPTAAPASKNLTQTNDEAMVTVAVTPLNLSDKSAATVDFDIALNTHSVDLGYDLTQIATLSSNAGEKVQPTKWNGPTGGGHHRDGTLSFPQLKNRGQTVTLTLRGIADVPERTFTWKVN
jgi:polyisoprenoid-binding protein YceI